MWIDRALVPAIVLLGTCQALAAEQNCQEEPECRRLSSEGRVAHNDQKDFPTAIERFQAAYMRVPDPRLLILLGRSFYKLGNAAHSIELYNQAFSRIKRPEDQAKLQRFIIEAQAVNPTRALPLVSTPTILPTKNADTTTTRAPHLSSVRLGLGLGFAALTVGALVSGIAANLVHGHEAPAGTCPPTGIEPGCAYELTPVFTASYAAAGAFAASTAITFLWPSRAMAERPSLQSNSP